MEQALQEQTSLTKDRNSINSARGNGKNKQGKRKSREQAPILILIVEKRHEERRRKKAVYSLTYILRLRLSLGLVLQRFQMKRRAGNTVVV